MYNLRISREDPVHRSQYSMNRTYTTTEQVCIRYTYDAQGRRICAEMDTRQVEHTAHITGFLRLHPKGS